MAAAAGDDFMRKKGRMILWKGISLMLQGCSLEKTQVI